jgi:hypothetical protein
MAKREKFSIWGREPDTKKGCYKFYKEKKKSWPLNYVLNEEETNHVKDMMDKYYYSPLKPEVQQNWKEQRDKIIEIKVTHHEIYGASGGTRLEFWTRKPTYKMSKTLGMVDGKLADKDKNGNPFLMKTIDDYGEMYAFSVARLVCFGGDGHKNESLKPRAAVIEALQHCISDDKIKWKKNQGYRPNIDPRMDAHHVDGKEFKTIYIKYLNKIEMDEDSFVKMLYPQHGNFETNHVYYSDDGTGWKLKKTEKGKVVYETFWEFHYKNREYEMVDPIAHQKLSSDEIKFNTSIKNKIKEIK